MCALSRGLPRPEIAALSSRLAQNSQLTLAGRGDPVGPVLPRSECIHGARRPPTIFRDIAGVEQAVTALVASLSAALLGPPHDRVRFADDRLA